jgi:uncharacterized protein with PhoU and TrkA domain
MAEYLTEVSVEPGSTLAGRTVDDALASLDVDADIVQLIRDRRAYTEPLSRMEIRAGDVLVLRTDREDLVTLIETEGLLLAPDLAPVPEGTLTVEDEDLEEPEQQDLTEVVIAPDASLVGRTLADLRFRQRYDASVLAIRRGGEIIHARMDDRPLRGGDTLLAQATVDTVVSRPSPDLARVRSLIEEGRSAVVDTGRFAGLAGIPDSAQIIEKVLPRGGDPPSGPPMDATRDACPLYPSDAAVDSSRVDLGGCRSTQKQSHLLTS